MVGKVKINYTVEILQWINYMREWYKKRTCSCGEKLKYDFSGNCSWYCEVRDQELFRHTLGEDKHSYWIDEDAMWDQVGDFLDNYKHLYDSDSEEGTLAAFSSRMEMYDEITNATEHKEE